MQAGEHVLKYAKFLEHARSLKGANQAKLRNLVRFHARKPMRQIAYLAVGRALEACNHIECSRFTGAIGANQADNFPAPDIKGHVGNRHKATELNGDLVDRQHRFRLCVHSFRTSEAADTVSRAVTDLRFEK